MDAALAIESASLFVEIGRLGPFKLLFAESHEILVGGGSCSTQLSQELVL